MRKSRCYFLKIMKILLLIISFFFTTLIGILALGNIKYISDSFFLVPIEQKSLTLPFLGFAALGILAGISYTLFIQKLFDKTKSIDEEY